MSTRTKNTFSSIGKSTLLRLFLLFITIYIAVINKAAAIEIFQSSQASNQFNLLTTNSIVCGFLFNGLSILLSNNRTPAVDYYEYTGDMDSFYDNIIVGIIQSCSAMGYSIIILLNFHFIDVTFLICMQLAFTINSFISLAISFKNVNFIIKAVRSDYRKPTSEELNRAKNYKRSTD